MRIGCAVDCAYAGASITAATIAAPVWITFLRLKYMFVSCRYENRATQRSKAPRNPTSSSRVASTSRPSSPKRVATWPM